MGGLFRFLYRFRAFLLFIALEVLCGVLIVRNNSYQGVAYLNTSNNIIASVLAFTNRVQGYFYLGTTNAELAAENAKLNSELTRNQLILRTAYIDTLRNPIINQYRYKAAKVINNSVSSVNNYITISRGLKDGLRPGMGVISQQGVVGRIKLCSDNFCTITSLLHSKTLISAEIRRIQAFGTVRWKGNDPFKANLLYIARHLKPVVGDTVVTSEYSTVFPAGVMVGIIRNVTLKDDDTFYNIDVELSTDFSTLSFVYVIQNNLKPELDSLHAATDPKLNEQ